jgi:hypothetical protein
MRLDELRQRFEAASHHVSARDDVDPSAAAWFTDYSEGTLRNRRSKGLAPAYVVLGCGVRYPIAGLVEFVESLVRNRPR